jgi:arylsulfatase A-like enzyme
MGSPISELYLASAHDEKSFRMATEVDSACGAILEELRRQGELDNTFIIFTTNNGNFHSEHGSRVVRQIVRL